MGLARYAGVRTGGQPLVLLLLWLVMLGCPDAAVAESWSWYWHRPVAAGEGTPRTWPALQRSLAPQACGTCHVAQYRAWSRSRHARALGPGVMAQLLAAGPEHRHFVQGCLSCHGPVTTQARQMQAAIAAGHPPLGVAADGVVCAACHLRRGRHYGPPLPQYLAMGRAAHGGFVPSPLFSQSRFCASCHQFQQSGARLDGVLLENTYAEWRDSRYAADGITCQTCHLRAGHHGFAGIHDPRFVARALTIRLALQPASPGWVVARLSVRNSGVGHDFPTYTTPSVTLTVRQWCGAAACPGSGRRQVIGRRISLDLRRQAYDTRLAPGAVRVLQYRDRRRRGATAVRAEVVVQPDAGYVAFFEAYLRAVRLPPVARRLAQQALHEDRHSGYVLWQRSEALPAADRGAS